ncbi:hypothetical protein [Spiroplasma ixodetis]|uniref:hypothetical protein n=1 Tax=Spiroplasma ixodetis TaxID=2141 RepID=UPI002575C4D2|nr:hypothetical protein [Spiroplasma ixodetis]WJG71177.1 hypothetical protein SIXOD_v1c25380 [Spiroplasma ixodetis Y32]
MNKEFTYLHEISYWLLNKSDFTHSEYNLSGSRYSSKTYSIAEELAMLIAISIKNNKLIAIYCFRKLNKDINELTKEINEALINVGFDYKDFILKYPNKQADFRFKGSKSFIRVMGVYSNSNDRIPLKGLSRSEIKGFDLAIEWCEEANEFSQAEFQAITFALGNAKKIIKIRSCNPDNIYQYFIEYMNNRVPFNLEIMKSNNEQIKSIFENNIFKLFHYSNWKVNTHNLLQDKINDLEELKILDPIKAQSWYYGVPSILNGAIFARFLDKVNTKLDFQPYYFRAGLDIGYATSPTGHPTAASLWCLNQSKTKAHKLSEFYHSNVTMQFKNSHELANSIIDYYLIQAQKYTQLIIKKLYVNVDYGNGGQAFIDILEKQRKDRNIYWLIFQAVNKEIFYLRDRIDFTTAGLIKNILSYDWNNCPHTKKQYSLIQWLDNTKKSLSSNMEPQMLDLHDDTWDSDCFALMNDMKDLIDGIDNELLLNKKRGVFNGFI